MIFFVILLVFVIILLIILLCPVDINIFIDNKIKFIKASIFFLEFNIYKNKQKKIKTNKNKKKESRKNKKKNFNYFELVKKSPKIIKFIIKIIKNIFKNISFQKIYILIKISSNEAKDTAIKYSLIQSVIDIINFDSNLILNKNIKIFSYPCFYSDKMQIRAQIKFKFLIIKFLYLVFISSLDLIKIIKTR
ncbi:MAG: hypothetical protein J6P21_03730 [Clostridia bacterium]|nr:hypothetical protein [Clostridia bacterium]